MLEVRPPRLPANSPVEEDFGQLWSVAVPKAKAYARWYLPEEAAMDAVHDAAAELFAKWDSMPLEQKTVAWFLRAVYYRVRDAVRVRMTEEERFVDMDSPNAEVLYPDPSPSPMAVMEHQSEWEHLLRFVDTLSPAVRAVWLLSHEQELTPNEIAEIRETSPKTVRLQLASATEQLVRYRELEEKRLARKSTRSLSSPSYGTEGQDD